MIEHPVFAFQVDPLHPYPRSLLVRTGKPWQSDGEYEFSELLNDTRTLKEAEEKSGRHGGLTYVLRLKQFK
jgi:hypothetical protein